MKDQVLTMKTHTESSKSEHSDAHILNYLAMPSASWRLPGMLLGIYLAVLHLFVNATLRRGKFASKYFGHQNLKKRKLKRKRKQKRNG